MNNGNQLFNSEHIIVHILLHIRPSEIHKYLITKKMVSVYNSDVFRFLYKRKYCGFLKGEIKIKKFPTFYSITDEFETSVRFPIGEGVMMFFSWFPDKDPSITLKNGGLKFGRYSRVFTANGKEKDDSTKVFIKKMGKEKWIENPNDSSTCEDFKNTILMDIDWRAPWMKENVMF
jgi:hypothetical protein